MRTLATVVATDHPRASFFVSNFAADRPAQTEAFCD